ncbi:MAG: MaoC family dehydratase [Myxococcales bacterium]|nr:MaoC family dehydratase [Myxococcales bacterium]
MDQEQIKKYLAEHANVVVPTYGRKIGDFQVGDVYHHPWDVTVDDGMINIFAASFMDANPLYWSDVYASKIGFKRRVVHPLLLLNLGLSFSVHDVSEQAIAHLAYIDVKFPNPMYPGETFTAYSEVLGMKVSESDPSRGVIHVRTVGTNEDGEPVVAFERKALVRAGNVEGRPASPTVWADGAPHTVDVSGASAIRHGFKKHFKRPKRYSGHIGFFEDFTEGKIFLHDCGKTVGESEHMGLTYLVRNSHPLHYDEVYSQANSFLKTRVVYGGLVFGWVASNAARDTGGQIVWDLGYDEGAHPGPVTAGDTIFAASKVLATEDYGDDLGIVTLRLVGTKNAKPVEVLAAGRDLFAPELKKAKDEKVKEKVFEITRKILVHKRP